MSIERVIILHGYTAKPSDHWFGSLTQTLEEAGVQVLVPQLPRSEAPELEPWLAAAGAAVGVPDENTAIVTHSLGGVTALHLLDRIPGEWDLGALVAVSGFVDGVPELPELASFTAYRPNLARTVARTLRRTVVLSNDDEIVPPGHSRALAAALLAETIQVLGAGHFLAEDGVTELPAVSDLLLRM